MKRIQKLFTVLIILLGVTTLFVVISAGRSATDQGGTAVSEMSETESGGAKKETADSAGGSGEVPGWLLYESTEAKFRLDYPEGWTVKEEKDTYGNGVFGLIGPQVETDIQGKTDIIVRYAPSVAQETVNQANGWKATTLQELISKDTELKKTGETEIGGSKAIEFISSGDGQVYGLFIEKSGRIYKIVFPGCANPDLLSKDEKQILSSFEAE